MVIDGEYGISPWRPARGSEPFASKPESERISAVLMMLSVDLAKGREIRERRTKEMRIREAIETSYGGSFWLCSLCDCGCESTLCLQVFVVA